MTKTSKNRTYPPPDKTLKTTRPIVVISPCLLGYPTRYDGQDKKFAISIPEEFDIVMFCPEQEAGLGTPREPIELVRTPDGGIRVMGVETRTDVTGAALKKCRAMAKRLQGRNIVCFILKARSPSCGIASPLHLPNGLEIGTAPGIWAELISEVFPNVPRFTEETLPPTFLEAKC